MRSEAIANLDQKQALALKILGTGKGFVFDVLISHKVQAVCAHDAFERAGGDQ